MKKIVGFLGFCAHIVLTVPVLVCEYLRNVIALSCIDDCTNIYGSIGEYTIEYLTGIPTGIKIVWNAYMNDDLIYSLF